MDNLLSFDKKDGHGGKAEEHRKQIEEIARELFKEERAKLLEEVEERTLTAQYKAYEQALKDVLGVLEYDIQSVTKIGIEGCREIFEGKQAQQFISDRIMKKITKDLNAKSFKP